MLLVLCKFLPMSIGENSKLDWGLTPLGGTLVICLVLISFQDENFTCTFCLSCKYLDFLLIGVTKFSPFIWFW